MEERRERDPDTGENIFVQTGAGIGDIFGRIAAKITGKTAKKLAVKAAEKGFEKIGEKTGQLVGEKIYDKFSKKTPETKGAEIMGLLQEPKKIDEFQYVKNVYQALL